MQTSILLPCLLGITLIGSMLYLHSCSKSTMFDPIRTCPAVCEEAVTSHRIGAPYRPTADEQQRVMTSESEPRDPRLLEIARRMIEAPSGYSTPKLSRPVFTPQAAIVDSLMKSKTGGFFVECGAYDGETASNTVYLEMKRGWSGLLIEADPYFYTQIRGKNRQAYTLNAGLSPYPHPAMMTFQDHRGQLGVLTNQTDDPSSVTPPLPCFPLETLLVLLNVSRVDYLSLDVEGQEFQVLSNTDWRRLDVCVLSVEYWHGNRDKAQYVELMAAAGYDLHTDIVHLNASTRVFVKDFIFVKKGCL